MAGGVERQRKPLAAARNRRFSLGGCGHAVALGQFLALLRRDSRQALAHFDTGMVGPLHPGQ